MELTALIYIIQDDSVVVSMDTLSLREKDKKPHKMLTKFLPLPHMNCLICGTGNAGAVIDWFAWVEKNIVANGIDILNKLTQQVIKGFMEEHNGGHLCTIYQFGLHEIDEKFYGFAYRSTNDFKCEELKKAVICVKPVDAFGSEEGYVDLTPCCLEDSPLEEILCNIMRRQKGYDDALDISERLGIGGMIQVVYMSQDCIVIKNLERFEDFEETYIQILNSCTSTIY